MAQDCADMPDPLEEEKHLRTVSNRFGFQPKSVLGGCPFPDFCMQTFPFFSPPARYGFGGSNWHHGVGDMVFCV